MPHPSPINVEEHISRMHSLRHEVRSSLHRAGEKELTEWQELEPETIAMDLYAGRKPDGAERRTPGGESATFRTSLERIVDRLSKLHAAIS